jgi:hypothetical protein
MPISYLMRIVNLITWTENGILPVEDHDPSSIQKRKLRQNFFGQVTNDIFHHTTLGNKY